MTAVRFNTLSTKHVQWMGTKYTRVKNKITKIIFEKFDIEQSFKYSLQSQHTLAVIWLRNQEGKAHILHRYFVCVRHMCMSDYSSSSLLHIVSVHCPYIFNSQNENTRLHMHSHYIHTSGNNTPLISRSTKFQRSHFL